MEATTDDTGTKLPTKDFTQDRDSMEDIGNQLVNIEHIQQVINQQMQRLYMDGDEETVLELSSLVPSLDGLQSSLRKAFDVHARRLIRKLHIFHLPDELLMRIFEDAKAHFDSMLAMGWHAREPFGPEPIRNLRLTCRRFCNASSHLLLESLDVSLTSSSLERLDEVSRHPAIPKGIRSLQINLALCSPAPASNLQDFVDQIFELLQEDNRTSFDRMKGWLSVQTDPWGSRRGSAETRTGLYQHIQEMQIRNEVLLSCTNYLRYGVFEQDRDQHMATLCQVFSQYNQRHDDQTAVLQDNTFARRVVEAAARMPKLTELKITDSGRRELLHLPTEFSSPVYDSVQDKLLAPSQWPIAAASMPSGKPSKLLYQLPETFFQAGVPLTKLKICLRSVRDYGLGFGEAQAEDLVTAAGNLESLELDYRFSMQELHSNSPPGSQICSSRFGSLLLNSTKLKSVTISFNSWTIDSPPMEMDAGPLLALLPWAGLIRFVLRSAYIHGDEFSKHLEKLSPGTYIRLDEVHLLTGLWADLLDVIREKADCNSIVRNAKGNQHERLGLTFDDGWDNPSPNPADNYIRGQISGNPLRTPPAQEETGDDDGWQDHPTGWIG